MTTPRLLRFLPGWIALVLTAGVAAPARADEIWVAPTVQQDFGGLGIASNTVWPVSAFGAVRLAWSVPDNLKTLQSAKVVLIPHSPGASSLNVFVCSSKNGDLASGNCTGPSTKPYTAVPNTLMEVEIAGILAPYIGSPGANYLAVIAYTAPTTATDHILGLRFGYEPTKASDVATLAANTFSGTQTAPAFVGNGSGLTGLPFPAGAATLGANTFSGTQTAPAFAGSGAALTGVAKLTANAFTATQTIGAGNLDLAFFSTATAGNITKGGAPFLHNFGNSNAFFGLGAGNVTMTGISNMAAGASSLSLNTTGSDNTGSGTSALHFNSSGEGNTATGSLALYANSVGSGNTANGGAALQQNTAGNNNTAIGSHALLLNNTGSNNTALGEGALIQTIGSNNTAVGVRAGSFTTGSNNVYLGAQVSGVGGESNAMYLGKLGVQTKTVIAGVSAVGVANAVPVFIDANGQLGTILSSIRFKEDVHDMADVSSRLMQLRPVTFRYTRAYQDGAKPIQFGLIAEEVAEVFPELAVRGADGQVETVHYETLNVLLLNEAQKQAQHIANQDQRIDVLERLLAELMAERASKSDNGDK